MMQMMMSQLRARLLHGCHQGAHRLLVALEAVRFLQLAERRRARPRTLAATAAFALGPREGLPGTLLLHERWRRPWRRSDQNDQCFPWVLRDGLLTYRPIGDTRPPAVAGTGRAQAVAAGAPSSPRVRLPVAVEQLLGVAGRVDLGDLARQRRYRIVRRYRVHLCLHTLLRLAQARRLRDSLVFAFLPCWKHRNAFRGLLSYPPGECGVLRDLLQIRRVDEWLFFPSRADEMCNWYHIYVCPSHNVH